MRKKNTFNQGWDENLICRSLEFFASQKIGMTGEKCIRKRGMINKKGCQLGGMTVVFCLLSGVAHAQCVPAPDCGELGYTAESCEGKFVRCPFDTTKLFCAPCDSVYQYSCTNAGEIGKGNSCNGKYIECGCADGYEVDGSGCKLSCATTYQYTCSGTGYSSGSGTVCGGKYESCTCASDYEWKDGSCQACDNSCTVGNIMYSDGTCSSCGVSGKTPIGIVVKDNALVASPKSSFTMAWGTHRIDLSLNNYDNQSDAKYDYNGRTNTATIIAEDSGAVATTYCNTYTTAGTNAGDWYLPAVGELVRYGYGRYQDISATMSLIGWDWGITSYWSSSEYGDEFAWYGIVSNGNMYRSYKDNSSYYVTCFLPISVSGGVAKPCGSEY